MTQRLGRPAPIRSGGFQGGVNQGAESPVEDSRLQQLASSLSRFTQTGTDTARQMADRRIEDQLRTAQDEAEVIKAEFRNYNAAQLGEAYESEEMARRFADNPYILPALQVHRGRQIGTERVQQMAADGVDIEDPEAVQEWAAENPVDLQDPFVARGFNEQYSRLEAQMQQRQLQTTLDEAEREYLQAAGSEFQAVFEDTGSVELGLQAIREMPGMRGRDATEVQMGLLRGFALRGDRDTAEALASAARGDAPSLLQDANVADDVQALLNQADLKWRQENQAAALETRTSLYDMIEQGVTRQGLESSSEFQRLGELGYESYQAQAIERHRANRQQAVRDARTSHFDSWRSARRSDAASSAVDMIRQGRGEEIDDVEVIDDVSGRRFSMSRSEQIEGARRQFRSELLGESPLSLRGEDAQRYGTYARVLADSDLHDPLLERHLSGVGALMTPEGIQQGNANRIVQGYEIYRNMDPVHARQYVTDTRSRTVFERIDGMMQSDPDMDVTQAAEQAVAMTHVEAPRIARNSSTLNSALSGLKLEDPVNQGGWGPWRGNREVDVSEAAQAGAYIASEAERRMALYNMSEDEALEAAQEDFRMNHTVVNGRPLRMPNGPSSDPDRSRETPESWARRATSALESFAFEDEADGLEGYSLQWQGGNSYILGRPNGNTTFLTAERIRRRADVWGRSQAREEDNERTTSRREAAERATARSQPATDEEIRAATPIIGLSPG